MCFSFYFTFVFLKIKKKKLKNQKNIKTVCVLCTLGTYVPWMGIETKFSKLCIFYNLDEHLYA